MQHIKEEIEDLVEENIPPHHRATKTWFHGRFDNPWDTWEDRSFADLRRWNKERRAKNLPRSGHLIHIKDPTPADFLAAFPPVDPDTTALATPPSTSVQAFWIGHATVLVQLHGLTFITDPVFTPRCSPISFIGPLRVVPPALTVDTIPHLDAVLISHSHYDHLSDHCVKALHAKFGPELKWFVPLGLASWFARRGIRNVVEMDWWDEVEYKNGVKVAFTPAQHWSMRGVFDRKSTLWGGWAVSGPELRFWFAGDTGYCPVFKDIGKRLGPFDLCAIPTGAYSPRWFMKTQHTDPKEAIAIHKDVKSKRSIAIHCCTWALTDEALDEPVLLLKKLVEEEGLEGDEFVTLRHGAHIVTAQGVDRNAVSSHLMPVPEIVDSDTFVPAE